MIAKLTEDKKRHWPKYLPELSYIYNNTKHSTTGYAPFYLMMGRHARFPIDLVFGTNDSDKTLSSDWVYNHSERLKCAYDLAATNTIKAHERQKKQYDKKANALPINLGERVLIKARNRGRAKLHNKWGKKPYIVLEQPNQNSVVYRVHPEDGQGEDKILHRNELKVCPFEITFEEEPQQLKEKQIEQGRGTRKPLAVIINYECQPNEEGETNSQQISPEKEVSNEQDTNGVNVRCSTRMNKGIPPNRYESIST